MGRVNVALRPVPGSGPFRARGDAGQALPFVLLMLVASVGAMVLLAHLGTLLVDRADARNAADAVALAGAADGPAAARRVASANEAVLESFTQVDDDTVEVSVRIGTARATARAEVFQVRLPRPAPG